MISTVEICLPTTAPVPVPTEAGQQWDVLDASTGTLVANETVVSEALYSNINALKGRVAEVGMMLRAAFHEDGALVQDPAVDVHGLYASALAMWERAMRISADADDTTAIIAGLTKFFRQATGAEWARGNSVHGVHGGLSMASGAPVPVLVATMLASVNRMLQIPPCTWPEVYSRFIDTWEENVYALVHCTHSFWKRYWIKAAGSSHLGHWSEHCVIKPFVWAIVARINQFDTSKAQFDTKFHATIHAEYEKSIHGDNIAKKQPKQAGRGGRGGRGTFAVRAHIPITWPHVLY